MNVIKRCPRQKKSKKAEIKINREQVVEVDPSVLPKGAKFKGYEDVVVQDILPRTG
jgi:3D (Asp-Asp-Asp) domain-containing protein